MSRQLSAWIVPLVLLTGLAGSTQQYQKARLVSLERKTRSRVLYYQVNTPVTKEDPYYEIGVDANHTTYVGEWVPRHDDDTPPDSWKVGGLLEVRLEKHYIHLKQPDGTDMKLEIKRHFATAQVAPAN